MAAIQFNNLDSLIPVFRSVAQGKSLSSRLNYSKAINCLDTFAGTYSYSSDFPSRRFLADWFLNMRARGISRKTAVHYLDIISALYKDALSSNDAATVGGVPDGKVFSQFKADLRRLPSVDCPVDDSLLKKLLSLTKSASSNAGEGQCAADILLYSLLNRALPLAEVAKVKTTDIDPDSDAIAVIMRRNAAPNRRYLFPLSQSKLTPRQLEEQVSRMVFRFLLVNHFPEVASVANTVRLIWACAAMKCGLPGSEILTMVGEGIVGCPELSLCVPAEISEERQRLLSDTVNSLFADNPLRWYAMKLRSRVDFEDVEERVRSVDGNFLRPEFFYPYDEIRKRVGKKIVKDRQPVIRDIVFFKDRVTDIFPLFSKIGDLAWCYTVSGKPGGDYAPIPRGSFERFQETIGHFTPEYEVAPIGGFEPEEGETVVIINGPLSNYEFEVDKAKTDEGNVIFQLNMVGDNGFQWRTTARKRQLDRPAPAKTTA